MTAQASSIQESVKKDHIAFQEILSDEELAALFAKFHVQDERKRKLFVRCFFWLMIFSAGESSHRGSLLQLIGFFLGAIALLFPESNVTTLTKSAVSKRLKEISWYLFRGVYNHLLEQYQEKLDVREMKYLGQFKDAFAVDGSVIALCKRMEGVFDSVHQGRSSLKLNTKYSLKTAAVTKLQVSDGKRHDSRFSFVTKEANCLYLVDLGYWSFRLMKKIIDAGSFFVMRLKGNCDPLIVQVANLELQHLVGRRLSELDDFLATQVTVGAIDLTVHLSKAKNPAFKNDVRLVGLFHEEQWRFYVTNIFEARFTPQLIYDLYTQRWQVEIFFNLIKHVLSLDNIISRTKNGIMIEIYSALIFYLLTRIVIALAAKKTGRSIHEFSFERAHKLIRGFMLSHFHQFLQPSLLAVEPIFLHLIDMVAAMGVAATKSKIIELNEQFA
jgi:IS4 transposase